MKKILNKLALGAGTIGIIVAGAAAFSAFEAHVVNVTATIENALTVPQELDGIGFGTVFPEEVLHKNLDITLSASFLAEGRVDDVEYMIRQKPKCGVAIPGTSPVQYSSFPQVEEDGDNFICPEGSVQLPLLCPYLSKHELTTDGNVPDNDSTGINAFHGPLVGWKLTDTIATQVLGRLAKSEEDTADQWDIDLHVPCFAGMCAQDNVIPTAYQATPADQHKVFGCDLWVEVTEISETNGNGTLTVNKVIVPGNDESPPTAVNFSFKVDGGSATAFEADGSNAVSVSAGSHSVLETVIDPEYVATYTNSLNANANCNNLVVPAAGNVTCTVTNTYTPAQPQPGTLTVIKHVDNTGGGTATASQFTMNVTGTNVLPASSFPGAENPGTDVTLDAGAYSVDESGGPAGYAKTLSAECTGPIAASEHRTCTITNTFQTAKITIHKTVVNNLDGTTTTSADFQMKIDGNNVNQDVKNTVAPGTYTISETGPAGYTTTFSGACNGTNQVTVATNDDVTCTVTNTEQFGTITVTKVMVNDDGGDNVVADFTLFVDANVMTSGVSKKFAPGTYGINESGVSGYDASFTGDCSPVTQQLTIAAGDVKACTITNNDIKPNITLNKVVINDNGGTALNTSFVMRIDGGPNVPTGSSKLVTSNAAHSITEDAKAGYHFVSLTGNAKCPAVLGGTATLDEGEAITCTITNSDDGGAQ